MGSQLTESDLLHLRKALYLIAAGLKEKLTTATEKYPYSNKLIHGINMFFHLSLKYSDDPQSELLANMHETAFIHKFVFKPLINWFDNWTPSAKEKLLGNTELAAILRLGALAYDGGNNTYYLNDCCEDFLSTIKNSDIASELEQNVFYNLIKDFNQEDYVKIREFVICHPIIDFSSLRSFKIANSQNSLFGHALEIAYEEIKNDCFLCPCCGWTLFEKNNIFVCHSKNCTETIPAVEKLQVLSFKDGKYRLRKGIMKYVALPGKLEMEIYAFCRKLNIDITLWPFKDTYDVELIFFDGEIWEIDAKAFTNPYSLCCKINEDGGFPKKRQFAKGYYVVNDIVKKGFPDYCQIVNETIRKHGDTSIQCLTLKQLKNKIRSKIDGSEL